MSKLSPSRGAVADRFACADSDVATTPAPITTTPPAPITTTPPPPGLDGDGHGEPRGPTGNRLHVAKRRSVAPRSSLGRSARADDGARDLGQVWSRSPLGRASTCSFVTMFGESSDWFFGPGSRGSHLTMSESVSGGDRGQVKLWDAGTEVDQRPSVEPRYGTSGNARRHGAADPNATCASWGTEIALTAGGIFTRPATSAMIRCC